MIIPDVIGFVLEEALNVIQTKGFSVDDICTTKPVNAAELRGAARVVRVTNQGDANLQIVVAYEDYLKGGV